MLRIALIQTQLQWEQPLLNRLHFAELMLPLAGRTDLVVLPEMFSTGFSMQPQVLAESMNGPTLEWMQTQAQRLQAVIIGSIMITDQGHFFNRLLWVAPDGSIQYYDKHHLFTPAGERTAYSAGQSQSIFTWNEWRICPRICYDLRFPEWSRQQSDSGRYDLLLYVANWPEARSHHWRALLQARAIENQCFTAGVNIVGSDGNQLQYIGDTSLVDYNGQILGTLARQTGVLLFSLDRSALLAYRERLPFLDDMSR
jgi:omega-amidase